MKSKTEKIKAYLTNNLDAKPAAVAAKFKARGWSWIDPTKEVEAYKNAIRCGLTTLTDVIAQTADGRDIEDVIATRRRELDMLAEAGIEVESTYVPEPEPAPAPQPVAAAPEDDDQDGEDDDSEDGEDAARARLRMIA
jgi:capsid protein